MALVPATLQQGIEDVFKANVPNATSEQTAQIAAMALGLATVIDAYLRSGMVLGTCVNSAGTGTIQGTIS